MAVNYKAELVGVFGFPVAENPTGVMQDAAFAALGLNWRYLTLEVQPAALAAAMSGLRAMDFQGINLTIPHKVEVLKYLDAVAPDAQMIGAVNTVRREGARYIGENTDGKGFLRGVREDGQIDPKGKRIVVLGAGGASRAICVELALAGAQSILVLNRTVERGEAMVADIRSRTGCDARFVHWNSTQHIPADADILVNATSIGLFPDVDAIPDVNIDALQANALVCDVIPNPPQTPFLAKARARGLRTLDGLSMLVYQGAIGFKMWTGFDAPEQIMKDALNRAFDV